MQRTDRSISDLLTDSSLPGGLLTPFCYRVAFSNTQDFVLPGGARSVTFLLITAVDPAVVPTVNLVPLVGQLTYLSEFPGDALPPFVLSGSDGDDVLVLGLTAAIVAPPPVDTIQDETGDTILDEIGQPLLPES